MELLSSGQSAQVRYLIESLCAGEAERAGRYRLFDQVFVVRMSSEPMNGESEVVR